MLMFLSYLNKENGIYNIINTDVINGLYRITNV